MKYHTLKSRQKKKKTTSRNDSAAKEYIVQTKIPAKDCKFFGHSDPTKINTNCSILTYQNTGQQPRYGYGWQSIETLRAFENSRASVAMYTKTSLNKKQLEWYDRFNDRMKKYIQKSKPNHSHYQVDCGDLA